MTRGEHPQRLPAAGGGMVVLIVANNRHLTRIWSRHLQRQGNTVVVVHSQADATDFMRVHDVDVIVLDLNLEKGSALAIADYASYRRPSARIVFVSNSTFFSDGSIFNHIPNAAAMVPEQSPPNDLAAIVEYHGRAS
ncbi:Response regulator receiver domain protein [Boseongicola aestuarii]|uniref:Response regulator receiver domain protein n=2 Tax=Boseongicola aestuarii TaxID=1470561 RepID=A0A238IWR2_9RHOB|nr:Response regulator receiver domain protein [Boseongicola aestuarii]